MRSLLKVHPLKLINILLVLAFCALPFQPIAAKNIHTTPPSVPGQVTIPPRPYFTPQQSSPTDPIYVAEPNRILRSYDFNDLSKPPTWSTVFSLPTGQNVLTGFILDPYLPDTHAYWISRDGIYSTDDLGSSLPQWTLSSNTTFINQYSSHVPPACSNIDLYPSRLLANPARPGHITVVFRIDHAESSDPTPCDGMIAVSTNHGQSWTTKFHPGFRRYNIHWRYSYFDGAADYGADGTLYVLEYLPDEETIGDNRTYAFVTQNEGDSWEYYRGEPEKPYTYKFGWVLGQPWYMRALWLYASRGTPGFTRVINGLFGYGNTASAVASDYGRTWSADYNTLGVPQYDGPGMDGFVDTSGVENVFYVNNSNWILYRSTNLGTTWTEFRALPQKGAWAVNPANLNYIALAERFYDSQGHPYLSIKVSDGPNWVDRTGDINNGYPGNRPFRITAPSFVRHSPPAVARSAVAGDDWDQTSMLANTAYQTQVLVGKPVNTWTGQYLYSSTDFTVQAQGQPLSFHRTYSTSRLEWLKNTGEGQSWRDQAPVLGPGWTHNFNIRLMFSPGDPPNTVAFQMANGSSVDFEKGTTTGSTTTYKAPAGLLAQLRKLDQQWVVVMLPDRTRYIFNTDGRVTRIDQLRTTDLSDATLTNTALGLNPIVLEYNTQTHLKRVTSGSTYLLFEYTSDVPPTVTLTPTPTPTSTPTATPTGTPPPTPLSPELKSARLTKVCVSTDPVTCNAETQNLPYVTFNYGGAGAQPYLWETEIKHIQSRRTSPLLTAFASPLRIRRGD